MKDFDDWLIEGPLKDELLTERQRTLLKIAYLQGAIECNAERIDSLSRIISPSPEAQP